jgi:hypothetical protein
VGEGLGVTVCVGVGVGDAVAVGTGSAFDATGPGVQAGRINVKVKRL